MKGASRVGGARSRVLILSHDLVGTRMAGPGLRYWELARVLARTCDVTLAAPLSGTVSCDDWTLFSLTMGDPAEIVPLLANADVVISSGFLLYDYPQLAELTIPWVIDAYIPSPTEQLALYHARPLGEQLAAHSANTALLRQSFALGDLFLCANERQRDLYLGVLASAGRLNAHTYSQDATLRKLIDTVPFGLPADPPVHRQAAIKGVWEGVSMSDKVVLWGGGVWDWLDPLTLVRAISIVAEHNPRVRLCFPGTRHPFEERVPDMQMRHRTVDLCDQLGVTNRHVFFGDWLPYQTRANYLLEADLGVSLHQAGIEARFAFRTRVLDYIWAGLPMVLTSGDTLADLAGQRSLGLIVEPGDVEGVASALLGLLSAADARSSRREAFQEVASGLTWEVVARPLIEFCQRPELAADRRAGYQTADEVASQLEACKSEMRRSRAEMRRSRAEMRRSRAEMRGSCAEMRQKGAEMRRSCGREGELVALVEAYERGRFIRTMAWLKRCRDRLLGRGRGA